MGHTCRFFEQQLLQGIEHPQRLCKWRAVLYDSSKNVLEEKYFDSQEERQTFLSVEPEWRKGGVRCPDKI